MRVAIYLRCAYSDRARFEEQRYRCLSAAIEAGNDVVATYEDFGQSGLRYELPGIQEMLTAAQAGLFDAVIVDDLSRLSRTSWHQAQYIERLKRYNVSVLALEHSSVV